MKIQVSEFVVRYLERLGIKVIFGMPGAHILPVYDSLFDAAIRSVLVKHEQGASFMAGGYARASGKIGACITTAGPGATNLVTGIANAYADKQPIIAITGEAPTYIFGRGGLQESSGEGGSIDQTALFKGITRYNKVVERTDYLVNVLNQASKILLSDNSGPVLLSFPLNIQKELIEEDMLNQVRTIPYDMPDYLAQSVIGKMCDLIAQSSSPVIVAGFGGLKSGAQAIIRRLSDQMKIPVTTSLKAKGVISEDSPLSLGCLGVTTRGYAYQYIVDQADLIIFLGASFNERTSYVWNRELLSQKTIIQIDKNPEQLEKVFSADVALEGDIKSILTSLMNELDEQQIEAKNFSLASKLQQVRKEHDDNSPIFGKGFELVERFYKLLEQACPKDIMLFDDNIIYAQNFFNVSSENRYFPNSGVSSLGHAIPAAIGARMIEDKATFAILGDGGFQMCCMELMTAVNYDVPITVVMFNNQSMGLIRKNQFQQYDQRFIDCDFVNPDFALLAQSFGMTHYRVENQQDLSLLFDQIDIVKGLNLIEIMIDKDIFPNYVSKR